MSKRAAVFCGSSLGVSTYYSQLARDIAHLLYEQKVEVVYGGGSVGLMGVLANESLRLGNKITGVIPRKLMEQEVGHTSLSELFIVDTMHQRKAKMNDLSSLFIALPGGIGTLEEIIEVFTWQQLDYHQKPCIMVNFQGYYDYLKKFMQYAHLEGFISLQAINSLVWVESAQEILPYIR